jgi:NAD(P)-dependent dehydrogenase (short-subunit alcohol dehydrogenase family)
MDKPKTCLITGATSGIGRAAALELARQGLNLILIGRNAARGQRLIEIIKSNHNPGRADFIRTDISSQSQVGSLAAAINSRYEQLDILINNAGARFDEYGESEDGLERTFATNHIGHYLLTCLVLEKLMRAPSARIITVSSGSQSHSAPNSDWYLKSERYNRSVAYAHSKLANVMFSYELARRLKNFPITSNAMHPGGVASQFARNNGFLSWMKHLGYHTLQRDIVLPRKAAETVVFLATSPDVEGITGKYFYQKREAPSSPGSYDMNAARSLWKLSVELTHLNESMGAIWEIIRP